MSDTPRTDGLTGTFYLRCDACPQPEKCEKAKFVCPDDMRQLERKLTACQEQLRAAQEQMAPMPRSVVIDKLNEQLKSANEQLAHCNREREAAEAYSSKWQAIVEAAESELPIEPHPWYDADSKPHYNTLRAHDIAQVAGRRAVEEDNKRLRHMLFMQHRHNDNSSCLYGDDGERQCNACWSDFNRDSVDELERKLRDWNMRELVRLGIAKPVDAALAAEGEKRGSF